MSVGSDWDLGRVKDELTNIAKSFKRLVEVEEEKLRLYKGYREFIDAEDYMKELQQVQNDLEQKDIIKRAQVAELNRRREEKEKEDGTIL